MSNHLILTLLEISVEFMQLPNKFEKQMDTLISEFPSETRAELTEFYFKTIRDSVKNNKINKNIIYSLHAAHRYKKYLSKNNKRGWDILVDDLMKLKAVEYRIEILNNLNPKVDYFSDKEFIYMPEQWMQTLVMDMREDCNLKSDMKLRIEIKEMLHKNLMNELKNIFLSNKKFGYTGNLILFDLIFYEKHILKIDDQIWELYLNNFENGKLIKMAELRSALK